MTNRVSTRVVDNLRPRLRLVTILQSRARLEVAGLSLCWDCWKCIPVGREVGSSEGDGVPKTEILDIKFILTRGSHLSVCCCQVGRESGVTLLQEECHNNIY